MVCCKRKLFWVFRAARAAAIGATLGFGGVCALAQETFPAPPSVIWSPDEISRMTPFMLVKAGSVLPLIVVPHNPSGVKPGGTWGAEIGTITKNGVYTAPRFTPAGGEDTLFYTDPQGKSERWEVRIIPNPAIPGSDKTPYLECPPEILRGHKSGDPPLTPEPMRGGMTAETKRFYAALWTKRFWPAVCGVKPKIKPKNHASKMPRLIA